MDRKMQVTRLIPVIAILVFCAHLSKLAYAAGEENKAKVTRTPKVVNGEVSAISRDFIAVVYRHDETSEDEMAFPVSGDVKIENKKSLSQIALGDRVGVEFDEVNDGSQLQRIVRVIHFLSSAPKKPTDGALGSGFEAKTEAESETEE